MRAFCHRLINNPSTRFQKATNDAFTDCAPFWKAPLKTLLCHCRTPPNRAALWLKYSRRLPTVNFLNHLVENFGLTAMLAARFPDDIAPSAVFPRAFDADQAEFAPHPEPCAHAHAFLLSQTRFAL